jgi:cytidylate kinase
MIITLDGPVASGKSTIAKMISLKNNFFYLYSGLFYRAFAYALNIKNISLENESDVCKNIDDMKINYYNSSDASPVIIFEGKNIFDELAKESSGKMASIISPYKKVRLSIVKIQHHISSMHENVIADGRDCGINVFPDAEIKFFLTASLKTRASRMKERTKGGTNENEILSYIIERDKRDIERILDPMVPAHNSYMIDTSKMSINETYEYIMKKFLKK